MFQVYSYFYKIGYGLGCLDKLSPFFKSFHIEIKFLAELYVHLCKLYKQNKILIHTRKADHLLTCISLYETVLDQR